MVIPGIRKRLDGVLVGGKAKQTQRDNRFGRETAFFLY